MRHICGAKVRIVGFGAENIASTELRVRHWVHALSRRGHDCSFYDKGLEDIEGLDSKLTGADFVIYGRTHNAKHVAALHAGRKLYGYKLIVDTDDLITNIPDYNFASSHYHGGTGLTRLGEAQYRESDAVTVSTPELLRLTKSYNPRTVYMPNTIAIEFFTNIKFRQKEARHLDDERIYWGGGGGHFNDLLLVKEPLLRLFHERPKLKLIFANFVPDWAALLPFNRVFFMPLVPFGVYPKVLSWICADVAVAPLCDNPHNRCKSHVKYLDYAMAKVAGVYQNLEPYSDSVTDGVSGFLASTSDEWYDRIKYLLDNPEERRTMAEVAYQDVVRSWNVDDWAVRYETFLKEMLETPKIEVSPLQEGQSVEAPCHISS